MTSMWWSLYLYCDDLHTVADALRKTIIALGYELYDPFGMIMPGKGYDDAIRLFVAPPQRRWVRVLGDVDKRLLDELSGKWLCLLLHLNADRSEIYTYKDGISLPVVDALTPYLRDDRTPEHLQAALDGTYDAPISHNDQPAIPMAALPDDVKQMADKLNPGQITKLFNKWMKRVSKRLDGDADAAHDLLRGTGPDWSSQAGQRLRAVVDCITLPSPYWRVPDFVTLRDAYQLHARRQRKPNATLFPGERQQLEALPEALSYVPVYGGKVSENVG